MRISDWRSDVCSSDLLLLSLRSTLALWLSLPAVAFAAAYPFAKRVLAIPQAILGLAFSAGMPMAFAAIRGSVDWQLTIALIAANLCWVIAYDTYYAMADRDDDLKIGVKSSAILFGHYDRLITAALQMLSFVLLVGIGLHRSEEHTSELQSLMRISYGDFCL